MKNPVYDPRSEDILKRLEELSGEFDDPPYIREAKRLIETLSRDVHRSHYLLGADGIRLTYGNHKVKTSGRYIPTFSDMYRYYTMYKNGYSVRFSNHSIGNTANFKKGFRVVRSKS
mgnify:CR=1 FL=1